MDGGVARGVPCPDPGLLLFPFSGFFLPPSIGVMLMPPETLNPKPDSLDAMELCAWSGTGLEVTPRPASLAAMGLCCGCGASTEGETLIPNLESLSMSFFFAGGGGLSMSMPLGDALPSAGREI